MADRQDTSFNQIYDANYNSVIKFVITKVRNLDDVQDIVQDVFVELYQILGRKGADYIINPEALLIKIAKTKLYRHYSLMDRMMNRLSIRKEEEIPEDFIITDREIDSKLDNRFVIEDIWKIIKSKSIDIQKVFYLYYYLDMPIREISKLMKMGESNIKHKIYRTLEEIRNKYKEGDA